jgi:hypothetical protein
MSKAIVDANPGVKNAIARIYRGNAVIGAGFLVPGGYVLTCAHVIREALKLQPEDLAVGQTIKINFPYIGLKPKLTAEVLLYRYDKGEDELDQDIAGLRLLDPLPANARPVKLQPGHQLHSDYWVLGFPKGHSKGVVSYGQLRMDLPNGWIQLEDTKAQGLAILPGFSGACVCDEKTEAVVGMVVARERNQPDAKMGFMIPALSLLNVRCELESLGLLSILKEHVDELGESVKTAYQLCVPQGWNVPDNLPEQLSKLQDAKRGDSQFEAIDRFVALLTLSALNPSQDLRHQLQKWLQERVDAVQPVQDEVQSLLTQRMDEQSAEVESHLLIHVKDESGESRSVSALFIRDASQYQIQFGRGCEPVQAPGQEPFQEKVTLKTLPQLVLACLQEVLDKSPANLTLHLILPLAWLNQACDRWSAIDRAKFPFLPDVRVGVRFRCVVRITERLNPDIFKMFQEPWQAKWQKLLALTPGEICAAFVLGDELSQTELFPKLNQPTSVGLKLSKVYEESQYYQLFGTLIAAGIPVAIWLRQDQFAKKICVATALDQLLNCKIATLPDQVKQLRTTAIGEAENAHIGHHLSFLLEDPKLIPPSAHPNNQMSFQMPQS